MEFLFDFAELSLGGRGQPEVPEAMTEALAIFRLNDQLYDGRMNRLFSNQAQLGTFSCVFWLRGVQSYTSAPPGRAWPPTRPAARFKSQP